MLIPKFHFPIKLYEIRKNLMIQNSLLQKDLQIFSDTVSDKMKILVSISKNTIKIFKFHF